jgi:hypothetical protein
MFELKRLTREGLTGALERAEHYRLLNEARAAESICLDLLEVDPQNQRALILLLLARTDQFSRSGGARVDAARELLGRIEGAYERSYYAGLICERWAKAMLTRAHPGSGETAYDWLRRAMEHYEEAEQLHEAGNEDSVLRWNACARLINQHDHVSPGEAETFHPLLE